MNQVLIQRLLERGPVASILGVLNLLKKRTNIQDKELLDHLEKSAERLDNVIKKIVVISSQDN